MFSEKNLHKLLDYENLKDEVFFEKMAIVLNLEYFKDINAGIHSIAGTDFVLDFQDGCFKLTFVDDRFYERFRYVEYFFNKFYQLKDRHSLYNHLRYFSLFDRQKEHKNENVNTDHNICKCIQTYDYCMVSSFTTILANYSDVRSVYNIFSHREEYHFYYPIFISISKDFVHNIPLDLTMPLKFEDLKYIFRNGFNLCALYDVSSFNLAIYRFFLTFASDFFFSVVIDNLEISITNNFKLLINGEYKKKESFLFKKGLVVSKCIKL